MRLCTQCGKQDQAWYVTAACSCGAEQKDRELPGAEAHAPNCKSVEHEVVQFPVRMDKKDLSIGINGKLHLPAHFKRDGWELLADGPKFYRTKMLCRGCIERQEEIAAKKHEYQRLCKAARGVEDMSYAQMLANQ